MTRMKTTLLGEKQFLATFAAPMRDVAGEATNVDIWTKECSLLLYALVLRTRQGRVLPHAALAARMAEGMFPLIRIALDLRAGLCQTPRRRYGDGYGTSA